MHDLICAKLQEIEKTYEVTILLAIESGSRAWGFASENSDYDVRFVYNRPVKAYLAINPPAEVIELPIEGDLDINGWDLPKSLKLFHKSNPSLLEWLYSPIVYQERGELAGQLRQLARQHYSLKRLMHHYLSMAKSNFMTYIGGKEEVIVKKYLYALRPLLCARWIEQNLTPPPTSVWDTLEAITLPEGVSERLLHLFEQKRQGTEMGTGPKDEVLNDFITEELSRMSAVCASMQEQEIEEHMLNELFWRQLGLDLEVHG